MRALPATAEVGGVGHTAVRGHRTAHLDAHSDLAEARREDVRAVRGAPHPGAEDARRGAPAAACRRRCSRPRRRRGPAGSASGAGAPRASRRAASCRSGRRSRRESSRASVLRPLPAGGRPRPAVASPRRRRSRFRRQRTAARARCLEAVERRMAEWVPLQARAAGSAPSGSSSGPSGGRSGRPGTSGTSTGSSGSTTGAPSTSGWAGCPGSVTVAVKGWRTLPVGLAQPPASTRATPSRVPASPNRWGAESTTGEPAANGGWTGPLAGPRARQALEPKLWPSNESTSPATGAAGSAARTTKIPSRPATVPPSTRSDSTAGVVASADGDAAARSAPRSRRGRVRVIGEVQTPAACRL